MDGVRLRHEDSSKHYQEMLQSINSVKNLEMISRSGCKTETSALIMSLCSQVICNSIGDILSCRELDLEDKMAVILPDFSKESVEHLIGYSLGKEVEFDNQKEKQEFVKLLGCLGIKERFNKDTFEAEVKLEEEERVKPKKKRRVVKSKESKRKKSSPWYLQEGLTPPEDDETDTKSLCDSCGVDCSTLKQTIKHLKTLTEGFEFLDFRQKAIFKKGLVKCPVCYDHKFKFVSEARFHVQAHVQECHDSVRTCMRCSRNKEYKDTREYFYHLTRAAHWRFESGEPLKNCKNCNKTFKLRTYYGHVKFCDRVHNKEYLLCEFCPFKTPHPHNLRKHVGSVHGIGNAFSCDQCDQKFMQMSYLRNHIREEHDKIAYVCQDCGREFKSKRSMDFHQKTVHLNVNRFMCAMCHGKFKTRALIRKHVEMHGTVDLYECSVCGEKFKASNEAYRHKVKLHNGEAKMLKNMTDAKKILSDKLIIKIEPEANEYGTRKPRITKAEPFLGVLNI